MTLNIKTGDWAVLRNGEVRGPLDVDHTLTPFPIQIDEECLYHMSWTAEGWEYLDPEHIPDTDIIATLPCPPLDRIRQLEEALRPFAEEAANLGDIEKDDQEYLGVILCGEIRAARRALGESK